MDEVLSVLSLAKKAGKAVSGSFSVMETVKARKAKIVIVSKDASDNTKKLFHDKCAYRSIQIVEYGLMDDLGRAVGESKRTVAALTDENLKKLLLNKLNHGE
ncbi:MAG: ribosomal L7Ae/L30e/S12e/Gadd45 family protein [Lachnospiraceae bacterium]|nr:ribosomal L7Ae/L30e/S12e/Gadd45 family protein [Lachnospiraceae bacterium]